MNLACLICVVCAAIQLLFFPSLVWAQTFPSRPIKFVTSAASGGAADIIARVIANKIATNWGNTILVENRPGSGGALAADMVAKAPADGHTVLVGDSSIWAINAHLYPKLPYDPRKSFAPVAQVSVLPVFFVIPASNPAVRLDQFIAHVKQNQGRLSYSSAGNGTIHHLTMELFKSMAGLDILHIPYKGAAPAGLALLAGDVQMSAFGYPTAEAGVRAGKLRILAINTAQRAPALPDIPTFSESGLSGFDTGVAFGMLVPAGTPPSVIAKLESGILAAMNAPDVRKHIIDSGAISAPLTAAQFGMIMAVEYEKYELLIKLAHARVD